MRSAKLACVLALALTGFAQAAPPPPPKAAVAPKGKLSIESSISALLANPRTRKVMDRHLPHVEQNPHYFLIQGMALRDLAPISGGKLTPEVLAKIEAELEAAQ